MVSSFYENICNVECNSVLKFQAFYFFAGIGSTSCSETYGLQKIGMSKCRDEEGN